jgi:hypothetical protein
MKTSRRMDGHTFSVVHWLYGKDGRPLPIDTERDPSLPPVDEFSAAHSRHEFDVTALREPALDAAGRLTLDGAGNVRFGTWCEVSFVGRGKVGHGTDLMLQDVGIWVSRLLQDRHPQTGEELGTAGIEGAVQAPAQFTEDELQSILGMARYATEDWPAENAESREAEAALIKKIKKILEDAPKVTTMPPRPVFSDDGEE